MILHKLAESFASNTDMISYKKNTDISKNRDLKAIPVVDNTSRLWKFLVEN